MVLGRISSRRMQVTNSLDGVDLQNGGAGLILDAD